MTKVFVVTSGCYSDYRIAAVFSTEAGANEYIEASKDDHSEFNDVEIYNLDEFTPRAGFRTYRIAMREDGSYVARSSPGPETSTTCLSFTYQGVWELILTRYVESEQHAVKIANEIRAQRIATLGWPGIAPARHGRRWLEIDEIQEVSTNVKVFAPGEPIPKGKSDATPGKN